MTRFSPRTRVSTYTSVWMPTGDETPYPSAGYFAGGYDSSYLSGIDKITFSDDSKSTLSATLTFIVGSLAGMANSAVAGYFAGGTNDSQYPAGFSHIDKITFPADTKSTLSATLTNGVWSLFAMANSAVAGYIAGGSAPAFKNNIDKITFSTDSKSTLSATLTTFTRGAGGFANSGTAGYFAGGYNDSGYSGGPHLAHIDKITFSIDGKSTLSATISSSRRSSGAMANSGVAGYVAGGKNEAGSLFSAIDKLTFSTEAISVLSATLTSSIFELAGVAQSGTAGYFGGGYGGGNVSRIDKITFSADTKSTLSATLTSARSALAGMADSGTL